MKKLFLLSVLILLPMLSSADAVEIDGIYYNLIEKAEQAEVTENPKKYSGSVDIPESIVYEGKTYGVTSIGDFAFLGCSGLTSVTIPNSVTSIGDSAFLGCSGLTSVTIPNSVTSIGDYAFEECWSLTSVTIPNSVTSIGNYAFRDCVGLTSVTIGNSVTSIGKGAFIGCSGLTSVYITDLAAWCKIKFDGDWISVSNPLSKLSFDCHLYLNGEEIKDLVIPNSVTSIGDYAFCECWSLTSVTIPNSVTSIGNYAFWDCVDLTSVTIGNSVTSIGESAFKDCLSLTSVTIGNSVTSIGDYAFKACWSLTSVTIPNSVTSIGNGAFAGSIRLTSVTIPNSVTSIGNYAFSQCNGLTSVTIGNSVTSIGDYAFKDCWSLTSVTIGSGVKWIKEQAFAGCKELKDVYCLAENVPHAETDALDAFKDSPVENMTLHVPANSLDAYKTTAPWSSFGNIVADLETDISGVIANVRAKAVLIQNSGNTLTISGADDGTPISVYAINGQLLGTSTISNGQASVQTLLQSGNVAIVKIGDKSVKVLMK